MVALAVLFTAKQIESWMKAGGYFVLFGLLFSCGLGVPLPEDIPLTAAGFLVAHGKMHLLWASIFAWCGIIGGDCVLYHFGKKYGHNITRVPFVGKHINAARLEKTERLFARYGVWVVAIGRLFAGVRAAMVVAAGTTRFNFAKFLIADGLAALVSGGLFIALGFGLGKAAPDVETLQKNIDHYKEWVVLGLLLIVILVVAYLWWRHKRHLSLGDILAEKAEHAGEKP